MAGLTPDQIASKWGRNTKGAVQSYKDGVMAVSSSPMEAAAAQADKAVQNFSAAITSGRWANNLRKVKLGDWQNAAVNKGADRIPAGVTQAMPKVIAFNQVWQPLMQQAKRELANMPNNSKEEALAKVGHMYDIGKRFAGKI
jgi:hypothetical protein